MRRLFSSLFILIIIASMIVSCASDEKNATPASRANTQQVPAKVEDLNVAAFKELVMNADSNTVILDVRTPGEFAAGHIENAILIDINSRDFKAKINQLDREKTYLVYCRTGRRSSVAGKIMTQEFGFTEVKNLLGGFVSYQR